MDIALNIYSEQCSRSFRVAGQPCPAAFFSNDGAIVKERTKQYSMIGDRRSMADDSRSFPDGAALEIERPTQKTAAKHKRAGAEIIIIIYLFFIPSCSRSGFGDIIDD